MSLNKAELTDAETISNGKEKSIHKGKHYIVSQRITNIGFGGHEGDRKQKDDSAGDKKDKWGFIVDPIDLHWVFPNNIPKAKDQVEDNNRPSHTHLVKSLSEDRPRIDTKSDNKGKEENHRIRQDTLASLL